MANIMKLNGTKVDASYIETIVIPRPDANYVFKARPITTEDENLFETLCPKPQPPSYTKPGGLVEQDLKDSGYLSAVKLRNTKWSEFLFLVSLDATPDLEWETVVKDDPTTWGNVDDELQASGFLASETVAIFNAVISANGLDNSKIEKATKSFLATQAVQVS